MNMNVIQKNHNMRVMQEISLQEKIKSEIGRLGISEATLARVCGLSLQPLKLWLKGKYLGKDIADIETALRGWLRSKQDFSDTIVNFNTIPGWQPTPTAKKILFAIKYAHIFNDISVIYGNPGLGKTVTAGHYQKNNQNVWLATMSTSTKNVFSCLERMAETLELATIPTSAPKIEQAIISRIKGIQGLLIIDEAQYLSLTCLEALRGIYDACSVGIVLMGNEKIYETLTSGFCSNQLLSRIGKTECFIKPENEDIVAILDAWKIKEEKARSLCSEIGIKASGLHGLMKTLQMARLMIPDGESVISYELVKFAWTELGGMA